MGLRIWTIGYEGHSPESFAQRLRKEKIQRLVDIRELPLSRKAGFSKGALALGLAAAGVEYTHLKALGTPRAVRHAYQTSGDLKPFERDYLAHVKKNEDAVADLETLARKERCVLMCVEAEHEACHRNVLGGVLEKRGWRVTHLGGRAPPEG